MPRLDPHSYSDSNQPEIAHVDWSARVDFRTRTLACEATLTLRGEGAGPLDLDTRGLAIESVTTPAGLALAWTLSEPDPVLGAKLTVHLPSPTAALRIRYETSPDATALQWLEPEQTSDGHPFLFSQCQAIHARSVLPLQDTPRVRLTYRARLEVPSPLRGLMAAGFVGREERGATALETYGMPQPIPPYLLAFSVGRLDSRELGPRSRVWAEPSRVEAAAWEFAQVDAMLVAAEALYGPYDWERFDLLVMPPSFPYGGMENPRLTFLTPTLIAGDRSLVSVVAHELAHSWTGNLVTNANAEHFWLNEGWTVFAERRIVEALEGVERAELGAALGRRTLERELARFADHPELTRLQTSLEGVDPDEAFSSLPYEKGYSFLRLLEETVGRPAFDRFVRTYIDTFRFRSIVTSDFEALVERELPGLLEKVGAEQWLRGESVPANAPKPRSSRLERLAEVGAGVPAPELASTWSPDEWQIYLNALPHPPAAALVERLDAQYRLSASTNMEVLVSFLAAGVEAGHGPSIAQAEPLLGRVGRMKYLRPLYLALLSRDETKPVARRAFTTYARGYHPIAKQVVGGLLDSRGA
jgi:aminopeptidase N